MFIKAIKDNKKNRDGYYCSLVSSERVKGKSVHKLVRSFGFIPSNRVPYLKAAFNDGDPEKILQDELAKTKENENA